MAEPGEQRGEDIRAPRSGLHRLLSAHGPPMSRAFSQTVFRIFCFSCHPSCPRQPARAPLLVVSWLEGRLGYMQEGCRGVWSRGQLRGRTCIGRSHGPRLSLTYGQREEDMTWKAPGTKRTNSQEFGGFILGKRVVLGGSRLEASGWSDRLQKMTRSRCSGSWRSYSAVSSKAGFNIQPSQGTGQRVSMTFNAASRLRSLRRAAPRG